MMTNPITTMIAMMIRILIMRMNSNDDDVKIITIMEIVMMKIVMKNIILLIVTIIIMIMTLILKMISMFIVIINCHMTDKNYDCDNAIIITKE